MKLAETDEFQDVEDCLRLIRHTLYYFDELGETATIKSLMVNLHNALSSACIAVLTRTDGGGALHKDSEKSLCIMEYGDPNTPHEKRPVDPKDYKVASLQDFVEKLPLEIPVSIPKITGSKTPSRDKALCRLVEYRNQFIHFGSASWHIERSYIQEMTIECLDFVLELIELGPAARFNRFQDRPTEQICIECIAMAQRPYGVWN